MKFINDILFNIVDKNNLNDDFVKNKEVIFYCI